MDREVGPDVISATRIRDRGRKQRARRRARAAGFTPLEQILSIAALLGCFVYPLSLAARAAGQRLAGQMDGAHKTLLTQRR